MTSGSKSIILISVGLWLVPCLDARSDTAAQLEFFERRIRPVLEERCFECHSGRSEKIKGGLRLDSREGMRVGGDIGPAIEPDRPQESLLLKAMRHQDPDLKMPPKTQRLPDRVIADFQRWIEQGAVWPNSTGDNEGHQASGKEFDLASRKRQLPWIWEPPQPQRVPIVNDRSWVADPVDAFVLAKLQAASLTPAEPADERTWLRRSSFAITGLPPTREMIRSFLNDESDLARARVVDRMLASPHFGERWARHWMDLVRYAESRGHESDFIIANAYHYRDYLIAAFNADVPYDRFVVEHVAGDLVSPARLDPVSGSNQSVIGTGWAFLGEEVHSPVDIRQDECDRTDNKIDVLTKTFLGLTVACARCHDHKFDAISQKDYYALSGFISSSSFRQVRFESVEHNRKIAAQLARLRERYRPMLKRAMAETFLPSLQAIATELVNATQMAPTGGGASPTPGDPSFGWSRELAAATEEVSHPFHQLARRALAVSSKSAPQVSRDDLGRVIADFSTPDQTPWLFDGFGFGTEPFTAGEMIMEFDDLNPVPSVINYGAARRDRFWNRLQAASGNQNDSGALKATERSGQMIRTPTVTLGSGRLHYLIKGKTRVYAAVDSHIMITGPLHGRLVKTFEKGDLSRPRWVTHDLSAYAGHRTHIEFGPMDDRELEVLMVVEADEVPSFSPLDTGLSSEDDASSVTELAERLQRVFLNTWMEFAKGATMTEGPFGARIINWCLTNADLFPSVDLSKTRRLIGEYRQQEAKLREAVRWRSRTAVAWADGSGVDDPLLIRGKHQRPSEAVGRSLPQALGVSGRIDSETSGRLALAQQLIDPENPLVARVMVNRVWHHLFGRGIVGTVDNFGFLGERATHPELLDHLTHEFVHEHQWSIKALIRRLILTQTYAMASRAANPAASEVDPENRWLHRMPVKRLEGEVIRDALLFVSGRMDTQVHGEPVPVHLTEFVIGRGRPEKSGPLDGAGRRSVYTAVRRNFLPTMMLAFDYPTPFSSVGRRDVTNVPAQSLVQMNDPLFHQQARVWAERLIAEHPSASVQERLAFLYESAFARLPSAREVETYRAALKNLRAIDDDEVESWTQLCHALLNLNEFIYVR